MVSKEGDIDRTRDKETNGDKDSKTLHGLRTVTFEKTADGFGFTLRHFVVYPPDTVKAANLAGKHPTYIDPTWDQNKTEAMDTIFVREVKPGSPAEKAGLVTGDRIVSINSQPVTGKSYQQVIDLIHKSDPSLELLVVPKEDDILQLYFASSAYQPVRRVPPPFPPWLSSTGTVVPAQRLGMSEPVSPVRGPIHYRPVDPARRIFFGLDPNPQSQPTSPYYHSVMGSSGATPRMPPSTSVPAHLSGPLSSAALASEPPKGLSGEEVPWQSHSQADSGIGSVEDSEAKARGAPLQGTGQQQEPSSLNLVAQRLHLFESGGLLARSLERMKLYRSELSRMSSGCPVPIVSVRAAKFQELDHGSPSPKPAQEESSPCGTAEPKTEGSSTLSATLGGPLDRLLPLSSPTSRVPSFDRSPDSPSHEDDPTYSSLPDQSILASFSGGSADATDSGGQKEDYMSRSSDDAVIYRKRNDCKEDKKYHLGRRISYLRATANERVQLESDQSEDEQHSVYSASSNTSGSHRIQRLKAFFGEKSSNNAQQPYELKNGSGSDPEIHGDVQGWLACKIVMVDGKKSSDRSWRPVWVVLRGEKVYILKDRKTIDFGEGSQLSLKTSMSDVARDYTKRKHVFRLRMESGTEYLFQADNHSNMMHWVDALRQITNEDSEVEDILGADKSVLEKAAVFEQGTSSSGGRLSPMPVARPVKKLAFRHRSPTSGSPKVKSRRASLGGHGGCRVILSDEPSLKAATMWRGKVVHSWKKFHGSLASLPPKGHSMGVPLSDCPPSLDNQYVPWLVSLCTRVVEAKGLETVGVYRIPGNSAAVAALSQAVASQGLEALDLGDPRWGDVHVVSSLLKAFLRQLPDPLVASLYPRFVAAAKLPNATSRLAALQALVHELPIHNFETLKFLMQHLKKVVAHSTTNKMEARNLAIVFGPTLVRTADNSMVTMITDMSHQCHITETLINYSDYIFSEPEANGCSSLPEIPLDMHTAPLSDTDSSVLLDNLHKVGGSNQGSTAEVCTKDLVSSLMSAANRKLRQRKFSLATEQATMGAALKQGSRVKDKIMAFECKSVDDSPKKSTIVECDVASNSYPPSPTKPVTSSPERLAVTTSAEVVSSTERSELGTEVRPCTYGQLSAMAQQKVRRLEEEMRAQLRASHQRRFPSSSWRHWSPTGEGASATEGESGGEVSTSVSVSGATREQIEREWQRAKQELEQDDLLDFMADDPSAFLLARRPVVQTFGRVQDQQPSSTIEARDSSRETSSRFSDPLHLRRDTLEKLTEECGSSSETFRQQDGSSSQHEKENIPESSSHPKLASETSSVTYRCKKQYMSGISRYAIYRVADDENGSVRLACPQADRQQRRSENGIVASLAAGIHTPEPEFWNTRQNVLPFSRHHARLLSCQGSLNWQRTGSPKRRGQVRGAQRW
uniref:Putative spectrin beta non-erythrocytic 2 n=1 Tax=Ornithodoros turicata TaxID=34597 RepID=A0A2R5L4R0_9ACAR